MTVTLTRHHFTPEERETFIDAVMKGVHVDDVDDLALKIADELPRLLKIAGLTDTDENRRKIIDLVLKRWSRPKTAAPSRSYRKFARRRR